MAAGGLCPCPSISRRSCCAACCAAHPMRSSRWALCLPQCWQNAVLRSTPHEIFLACQAKRGAAHGLHVGTMSLERLPG